MAKYRQVQTSFWQDSFILELVPEEKFFYLYLMTNSKTSQCGIYELPYKVAEVETGYTRETVEKYINRFIDYGKIKYDTCTKEIMVQNWCKWNWSASPKVQSCIKKELEKVKNPLFAKLYMEQVQKEGYSIDSVSIDLGEKEKEKEKEIYVQSEPFAPVCTPSVEKKKPSGYTEEFESFWSMYPRKTDKKAAFSKFKTCLKTNTLETILKGTEGYKNSCIKNKTEVQFIKHPKTFLNNESFNDFLNEVGFNRSEATHELESIESTKTFEEEDDLWTKTKSNLNMNENGSGLL